MTRGQNPYLAAGVLAGVLGCGPPEAPRAEPRAGDLVTWVGSGAQGRDPIELDASGNPAGVPPERARLDTPVDLAFDTAGTLFVIDWNAHLLRRLGEDGLLHPVAGGTEGDGCSEGELARGCPPLAARLDHPTDLAFASDGSLFVSAWHNSKIKRISADGGALGDVCGSGARDYLGDGGGCFDEAGVPLVALDLPSGVAFDAAGNLFVADQSNQVVRRLGTDGVVKTVCGSCPKGGLGCPEGRGYSGDGGPATQAKLDNSIGQAVMPAGKIAFAPDGALFIADTFNHVVRRVTPGPDGVVGDGDPAEELIETVAGSGERGFAGDGGDALAAALNLPTDLAFLPDGSYFIADRGNHCVRYVDSAGVIATAAGRCGLPGSSGDGGPAPLAFLDEPFGVAIGPDGGLVIADSSNHRVRRVVR